MEHVCFLDIETIPTQSQTIRDRIKSDITPPGNIKKPESIQAWMDEHGEAKAAEVIGKTSFDPALGHICTIAWSIDGQLDVSHASEVKEEREVLETFFESLKPHHAYTFVGHNVAAFDLRFILCRAVVLGVKIPPAIPRDPKPWGSGVFDTMTAWAGAKGTISMDNLSTALGLKVKGDFTGADVAAAWAAGEHHKIALYCAEDVKRTMAIYAAFQAAGW